MRLLSVWLLVGGVMDMWSALHFAEPLLPALAIATGVLLLLGL